jgi:hypothetical protein
LWFLDDDNWMKTAIGLTKFALKAMTLCVRPTKRYTSRGGELDEASEQSRRSLPKNLIRHLAEDDGSGDLLSRSQMHVDERDEVASAAQQQKRRAVGL